MEENLAEKSLAELRMMAKDMGIRGVSGLRKQELIARLSRPQASEEKPGERENGPQDRSANSAPRGRGRSAEEAPHRGRSIEERPQRSRQTEESPQRERTMEEAPQSMRRRERESANEANNGNRRLTGAGTRGQRSVPRYNHTGEGSNRRYSREGSENTNTPNLGWNTGSRNDGASIEEMRSLDSGVPAHGILEVMPDGFGFIRCENYLPGDDDVYVSPSQIRRFNMKTGDIVSGSIRIKTGQEKFAALLYVNRINDEPPSVAEHRKNFEDLTPVFPDERIHLEIPGGSKAMRIVDLLSPIGKGQRGMIVSPPKAGKTTLLKEVAKAVKLNHPEMHLIILLIDERPEEVTDIKESIEGPNVEVIYSTFDELPDHHKRVSEMVLGRAKRLVEHGRDVVILLDSITRLARAYNLTVAPSGRTLSGGLDPAALHMPKKFFGAARNMREGGSLTILATALVDTGSRMDDVVFEEFKGTGNMELVLDRKLSERRIFPAIDIPKSGTRREDLLLAAEEKEAVDVIRKAMSGMKTEDAVEQVMTLIARTRNNREFIAMAKKIRI